MAEGGEGIREEAAAAGVHEDELGGEDDVIVEGGAEEACVEVAEVAVGGRGVEEGEVVGNEVGFVGV